MHPYDHFSICQWHRFRLLEQSVSEANGSNKNLRNDYRKSKRPFRKTAAGWSKFTFFFGALKMEQIARVHIKVEQY